MIADMFSNKKSQPIVTKLFTRVKTTIFFLFLLNDFIPLNKKNVSNEIFQKLDKK